MYAKYRSDYEQASAERNGRDLSSEDDLLAFLLIHTWTLATGRVLPSGVPPTELSEEELIAFWADDHIASEPHEPPSATH